MGRSDFRSNLEKNDLRTLIRTNVKQYLTVDS